MRIGITILVILLAGALALYFFYQPLHKAPVGESAVTISSTRYEEIAKDIARNINDISPTPPTAPNWQVESVEFVKGTAYAYVDYNDMHNLFRLLLEIHDNSSGLRYILKAAFEPGSSGWKLVHGEDLGANKEVSKITINNLK